MKHKLFVAQGANVNAYLYAPIIILILFIPTVSHGIAGAVGMGDVLQYPLLAFDIFIIILLMKKLTPQYVVIRSNCGDGKITIRGKFENESIKLGKEVEVNSVIVNDDSVCFFIKDDDPTASYNVTNKYFSTASLKQIPLIADDIKKLSSEELVSKHTNIMPNLKVYDTSKSTLVRLAETPSHNKIVLFSLALFFCSNYIYRAYFG